MHAALNGLPELLTAPLGWTGWHWLQASQSLGCICTQTTACEAPEVSGALAGGPCTAASPTLLLLPSSHRAV